MFGFGMALEARLAEAPSPDVVAFHPSAHQRFCDLVDRLSEVLRHGDSTEIGLARTEFRRLIRTVVVTPRPERGAYDVVVESELAALMAGAERITKVGAGTRTDHKLRHPLGMRFSPIESVNQAPTGLFRALG